MTTSVEEADLGCVWAQNVYRWARDEDALRAAIEGHASASGDDMSPAILEQLPLPYEDEDKLYCATMSCVIRCDQTRVSICAARTLNPRDQARVTLSPRYEQF